MPVETSDILQLGFVALAIPFVMIAGLTRFLSWLVARNSRPSRRAAWLCGIAYAVTTIGIMWPTPPEYWIWVPLAGLPAALIAFWFWRSEFRRAWIEDPAQMPPGETLDDDDWQSGLMRLALFVVLAIGGALAEMIISGMATSALG